jgi:phytoene synthase
MLRDAGIEATDPAHVLASPALGAVCARMVERARAHFGEADKVMARSPRRRVRAPRIMGEAYRLILDSLAGRGWSPPRRPIRLSRARLLWLIMRHAFI